MGGGGRSPVFSEELDGEKLLFAEIRRFHINLSCRVATVTKSSTSSALSVWVCAQLCELFLGCFSLWLACVFPRSKHWAMWGLVSHRILPVCFVLF